jgi:hypothetical protein
MEDMMKHQTLDTLRQSAAVLPLDGVPALSRRERLERWAIALETHGGKVRPFSRTEYLPQSARTALRGDDTPVTVAFADPLLRAEGLAGDTYGDALTFFALSEREAHHLLCDCHYGGSMTAANVAARLRATANKVTARELWERAKAAIASRF